MTATSSDNTSSVENFQRDLAQQLAGVDQQTFQEVKHAIQSALNSHGQQADPASVIQHAQREVRAVLQRTAEGKSYYATVTGAVASAGSAIGQVFGAGAAGEEADIRAGEALQPLKAWLQRQQPSERSTYTREEQQEAPSGYFSRQSQATQDSGPNDVSATQHTSEAGRWTSGESGNESAMTYDQQVTDSTKHTREGQTGQNSVGAYQGRPVENFSRNSHQQSDTTSLQGDAQKVGLEEAMRRARRPF